SPLLTITAPVIRSVATTVRAATVAATVTIIEASISTDDHSIARLDQATTTPSRSLPSKSRHTLTRRSQFASAIFSSHSWQHMCRCLQCRPHSLDSSKPLLFGSGLDVLIGPL
ncbi:hypothetical protein VIGAN_05280600, partial [Vigna angularis var. angularis]